jgi:RNA polymerase sigma-70 factor (ECF subfamily)
VEVAHAKDLEFAGQIAAGDEAAAAELFRRFSGEIFGYSRKMIGDPILSEDVLQEAMLGILRSIDKYDGRVSLRAWGYGILRHKIVDALRKRGREPIVSGSDPESEDYRNDGHWKEGVTLRPWNENVEVLDVVRACMDSLPHNQREALFLRALEGMPAKEVAAVLEMSYANLRQVLHRARQSVRRCADQALGPQSTEEWS